MSTKKAAGEMAARPMRTEPKTVASGPTLRVAWASHTSGTPQQRAHARPRTTVTVTWPGRYLGTGGGVLRGVRGRAAGAASAGAVLRRSGRRRPLANSAGCTRGTLRAEEHDAPDD